MMNASPLEIQLLGPVEITYQDEPLKISRRVERAILYLLAVEHKPISRTTLIDMLWPEAEQMDPRGALRTALSRLRSELPDSDLILTEFDQVWIDLERCNIDLVKFIGHYQSLKNILGVYQENRPLPSQIVKQIQKALALWHGDTIIHGDNLTAYVEFESWRQSLDRTLGQQRKFLINKLAKHFQAAGKPEMALELFVQIGQQFPLDIDTHVSVLETLITLGRHQELLNYCDHLEEVYETKFNAPLPNQILEKCQFAARVIENTEHQSEAVGWPLPLTMQLEMVDRRSELDTLKNAYFQGGLVLIRGELGSGKTRLVQELFYSLTPTPKLFLAPSREMENSLPLSPIIHALRQHVEDKVWKELDTVWANQISLLLPELANIREDCRQNPISKLPSGKQHLFDALYHVFQIIATRTERVLFFLDDAQWADTQTLQALAYLVSQGFFDDHGLLVIATRPEEPNPELNTITDQFHRTHLIQTINLTGLSPNELSKLAQQVLDQTPSIPFIEKLFRETSGNPFLALEIIRNILEEPSPLESHDTATKLPLPTSVHALIRRRLNRLCEASRHVLLCAAVIGNSFSLKTLQLIANPKYFSDFDAINSLIKTGFLHPTQKENFREEYLHFAHEKMREVILKEASPAQLQHIHLRAAKNLANRTLARSKAAIIANHFLAGGDIRKAFDWYLLAAEHAWTLGAREDVLQAYQQAEKLFRNAPDGFFDIEDIYSLYQQWSDFAYQSNQADMLEETGIKMEYFGKPKNNFLLLGGSKIALANACFLRLKFDTGLELINKAIENLEYTHNKQEMGEALLRKAAFQWWKLDYNGALETANKLLSLLATIESESPRMISLAFNTHHSVGFIYYAKGNAKKALQNSEETYRKYFYKLNSFDKMRTLNMLAYANLTAGNYDICERFIDRGLEITHAIENTFVEEILLTIRARVEVIQGYLDEAYIHASEVLKMGEENNHTHTIVSANCILGDIFFNLQNYSRAMKYYRVAQIREGFSKNSIHGIENDIHLARLLSWLGPLTETKEILDKTLKVTKKSGMNQLYAQSLLNSGLCDLIDGELIRAENKFSHAFAIITENGLRYEAVWCKIGYLRLALSRHEFESAKQILDELLEESTQINSIFLTLYGLELSVQLQKNGEDSVFLDEYRAKLDEVVQRIDLHTQSDALRGDFLNAKRLWQEGHRFP